jgi:ABC-type methionine transport system ATPase subunit
MGFRNQEYSVLLAKQKQKSSNATSKLENELLLSDDSPAKIDPMSSNRILYIQVMLSTCVFLLSVAVLLVAHPIFVIDVIPA